MKTTKIIILILLIGISSSCVSFNKAAQYPKDTPVNTDWKIRKLQLTLINNKQSATLEITSVTNNKKEQYAYSSRVNCEPK